MIPLSKERLMVVEEWLQQAVEKLLKALILYSGGELEKTHSLVRLRALLKDRGVDVYDVLTDVDVKFLQPYYIGGRYPLARYPIYEDSLKALKIVEKVKRFVEREAGLEGIAFDLRWWESV